MTPTRTYYSLHGHHSVFRDMATVAAHEQRVAAGVDRALVVGGPAVPLADPLPAPLSREAGSPGAALERLKRATAASESRAMNATDGSGGEFIVTHGVPAYVAEEFVRSAVATAVVSRVLRRAPLPESGDAFEAPVFLTGPSVATQAAEGDAVSNADPTTGLVHSELWTAAGYVDVSQQFLDRARPQYDIAIAGELGRRWAAALDTELLTGPASTARRLVGLLNVSGRTADTYTDASPTPAEFLAALGSLVADVAAAYDVPVGQLVAIMHPRRRAWVEWKAAALIQDGWPCTIYDAPAIPTNLGSGTNEDRVIVLDPSTVPLALDPQVRFQAIPDFSGGGDKLQVRLRAYAYAAAMTERQPKAVGVLSGTGLATPTF